MFQKQVFFSNSIYKYAAILIWKKKVKKIDKKVAKNQKKIYFNNRL